MPDAAVPCPQDLANRVFKAERPNQLWASNFTYVSTWQGWLYMAFVIDVFARRTALFPPEKNKRIQRLVLGDTWRWTRPHQNSKHEINPNSR